MSHIRAEFIVYEYSSPDTWIDPRFSIPISLMLLNRLVRDSTNDCRVVREIVMSGPFVSFPVLSNADFSCLAKHTSFYTEILVVRLYFELEDVSIISHNALE